MEEATEVNPIRNNFELEIFLKGYGSSGMGGYGSSGMGGYGSSYGGYGSSYGGENDSITILRISIIQRLRRKLRNGRNGRLRHGYGWNGRDE